jgi:hypothetical protein
MKPFANIAVLVCTVVFTAGIAPLAFAAGDYVWEEKFKAELPKAKQGKVKSQYAVGEMYEKGKGAEKDTKKAFEWYMKAANQGNKKAAYKVGLAYLKARGIRRDYQKAHRWLKQSAAKNYVRAQYYLGEIYENGHGVPKNYDQAMKWYKQALEGGYGTAAGRITRVALAQKASKEKRRTEINKPKPRPKPKSVSKPNKPKPITSAPKSTKKKVLAGGWKKRNRAVEYLPSEVTRCKDQGRSIECFSAGLKRNIGVADINYTTKAILFSFKDTGHFKISYRNNVTAITVTDPEFAESGGKVPVTLGWQDAEHKLVCSFEDDRSLICIKNKLRKVKLHR